MDQVSAAAVNHRRGRQGEQARDREWVRETEKRQNKSERIGENDLKQKRKIDRITCAPSNKHTVIYRNLL